MTGATFNHPSPIYRIEVDGVDIGTTIQGRLSRLTHTDNRGFEADQLDIDLDDSDGRLDLPPRGAEIRLWYGWAHSGLVFKGTFTVDEIEHTGAPDMMSIRARSADLRSGLTTQRERSWHAVTLGTIVETIAGENDLTAQISAALARFPIAHIDQTNESSANLLTRLAEQFDAIATIKNGNLLFMPMAGGRTVSGRALPTLTITREAGDRHRFSIADRETCTAVRATYNDVRLAVKGEVTWGSGENAAENHEPIKTEAQAATTGQYKTLAKTYRSQAAAQRAARKEWTALKKNKAQRAAYIGVKAKYDDKNLGVSGEVPYGDIEDQKRSKSAAKRAEKDRAEIEGSTKGSDPAFDHSADNIKTLRHVYANKENALRAARAEWRRLQRGIATFSITLARGRTDLLPDIPVTVRGWKPAIDSAAWILAKLTNTISDDGFTSAIELEVKATEVAE